MFKSETCLKVDCKSPEQRYISLVGLYLSHERWREACTHGRGMNQEVWCPFKESNLLTNCLIDLLNKRLINQLIILNKRNIKYN